MQNNKLVTVQSPLSALGEFEIPAGITLAEVHARYGSALPTVVVLNGAPVMRAEWGRIVTEADSVTLAVMPAKGGFKQILAAAALIALAVVAPGIGTAIAGSGIAGNLAAAGIVLAGSLLINALLAPKTAKTPADITSVGNSPTYSLAAEGNQARLLQPIPRLYGRHIINADFAAKPYVFFEKNDQYLCQLFCLGVGLYDLEEIRIDKTALWRNGALTGSYSQVQIQKVEPGQPVTIFRPEVETSSEVSGQELVRLFNANVNVDFQANTMFSVGGPGTPDTQQFFGNYRAGDVLQITQSNSNNGFYNIIDVDKVNNSWIQVDRAFPRQGTDNGINFNSEGYVGPFTTNPANTQINKIEVDISFPEGSWAISGYQQNGNPNYVFPTQNLEIQWRKINSIGQPLTDWISQSGPSNPGMSFAYPTFNERRETRSFDVEPGRYEVRMRRMTQKLFQQTAHNTINWVGLKAYYSGVTNSYPDVTTIAIKIRADNQISSQTSRKFSFIQTAKIPTLQGDLTFTAPTATRRISDAFCDAVMNPVYGAGLPASRIDLAKILELEGTWSSRGDTFDGVFDSKYTMWDALTAILFVGRSKPLLIGGVLTAVRDQPRALPRGVFTPQNMLPGSLEIDHVMYDENSPTDAKVSFIDERTWAVNEVECFIDDDDRDNPVTINGFGIVKREHAWREGIYQVASNKYRRIFATFGTEMEGKLLIPLDKVMINHDLPRYGQSGSLVDLSSDAIFWRSTEPLTMPIGGAVAALRTRTGGLWGPVVVAEVSEEGTLIRLDPQSLFDVSAAQGSAVDFVNVGYNNDGEPAAILFGTTDSYSKAFRVISAIPRSESQISILCTNEDSRVHTAETDYLIPSEDGLASLI